MGTTCAIVQSKEAPIDIKVEEKAKAEEIQICEMSINEEDQFTSNVQVFADEVKALNSIQID